MFSETFQKFGIVCGSWGPTNMSTFCEPLAKLRVETKHSLSEDKLCMNLKFR